MCVIFVHPLEGLRPSGGHVYNRHLLVEARRLGFPLQARPVPIGRLPPSAFPDRSVVVWDSLFLDFLAGSPPGGGAAHGLLVHYLPFLNPVLDGERRRWAEAVFERAASGMRFFLATGAAVARLLEARYPERRVFLAEPGVEPLFLDARRAHADPPPGQPVRIATVANLLPAKGQKELLEMLAEIAQPDWVWHVVGDEGSDPVHAAGVWARAEALGFAGRIVRHGILEAPALARRWAETDLGVFPSRFEAYGMALAEAAAAGVPIVTTGVGEAARVVRHGETGFVVEVEDRVGFREALAKLMADGALRRRFRTELTMQIPRSWEAAFLDFAEAVREIRAGMGR
jgi:glycosyltransferase involved in cell wall biosynthesis